MTKTIIIGEPKEAIKWSIEDNAKRMYPAGTVCKWPNGDPFTTSGWYSFDEYGNLLDVYSSLCIRDSEGQWATILIDGIEKF